VGGLVTQEGELIMDTRAAKMKSAEATVCSGRTYSEYLGDVTPVTANEMLTDLFHINLFVNNIHEAADMPYTVDLLHDADGRFVGLVLIPEDAAYWIEGEVVQLSDERPRTRQQMNRRQAAYTQTELGCESLNEER
jgi:hypothetical protein